MPNESAANPSTGSFLKFYSLGVVAANKPLNTHDIEVTPIEDTNSLSGEVTDNISKYAADGQSTSGGTFKASVDTTVSVKATWYSGNDTNRITSPDVYRGETVELWRMADSDQYWWKTSQQNKTLRRLETVTHSYSNNSKADAPNDANSTYFSEVSTHRKTWTIHTSKNDGEPFSYDIQINAKDGNITIQDDDGNYFFLDSTNRRVKMMNGDGSLVDLNRKDILIDAPNSITLRTKVYKLEASTSNSIESPTNSTKGDTQLIKATTTVDGTLTVTKMTTMQSGFVAMDMSGALGGGQVGEVFGPVRFHNTLEANGPVTMTQTLDVTGQITTPVDISAPNV
jgi:hypothetical protein